MINNPLPRLDLDVKIRESLIPSCRFKEGIIIEIEGHKVGCLDASNLKHVKQIMGNEFAILAIHDPPYNFIAFQKQTNQDFIAWCKLWVLNTNLSLDTNASLYIWLGADQKHQFQPLPDFMFMMRETPFESRSFITMRNQRGYGTQKNWMAVRQELLYYTKGNPVFNVQAEYTDIPRILQGYYKNGIDNNSRSKAKTIRAGNVWVDIQQVFYRMQENVSGCYAQKPLKAINRIIQASSEPGDIVIDFFAHSGTTLLSAEINQRRCFTIDNDPLFCELTLRRLEHYLKTKQTGWQNDNPFGS